jgi:hypothetical protein
LVEEAAAAGCGGRMGEVGQVEEEEASARAMVCESGGVWAGSEERLWTGQEME